MRQVEIPDPTTGRPKSQPLKDIRVPISWPWKGRLKGKNVSWAAGKEFWNRGRRKCIRVSANQMQVLILSQHQKIMEHMEEMERRLTACHHRTPGQTNAVSGQPSPFPQTTKYTTPAEPGALANEHNDQCATLWTHASTCWAPTIDESHTLHSSTSQHDATIYPTK